MSGVLNLLLAGAASAIKDAYFNLTTLLLNTSSTNGAQNNTFLDSSTNNFTITRNGNTTQGTFTPFSQTGWGNFFNGTTDYLSPGTTATNFICTGTTSGLAATFEAWVFPTSWNNVSGYMNNTIWAKGGVYATFGLYNGTLQFFVNGGGTISSSSSVSLNTWSYVAVTLSGSTVTFYINGVSAGSGTLTGGIPSAGSGTSDYIAFQAGGPSNSWFAGYLSNFRISNVVRTISSTPTTAFTSDANTVVLSCQSNRFKDNSTNAFAITVNGTPSVQAFSPFLPTAAYSTSVVGGSGYFDGTGDYLDAGSNAAFAFGTGAYTVEFWVYPTPVGNAVFVGNNATGGFLFYNDTTDGLSLGTRGGSTLVSSGLGKLIANQWNHIVFCRSSTSSNQASIFANGVRVGNGTDATNWTITGPCIVGGVTAVSYMLTGYMCGLRIVKGTDVYGYSNTTITVPTAPPTAITNTQLLLNYTNSGIYDSTAKNDLETVGNAQVSTTQAKWGTTSMAFDATGDQVKTKAQIAIGSGDYTIEGWVYGTATGATYIFDMRETSQYISAFTVGATFYVNLGATLDIVASTSFAQNTWTHFAIVRSGSGTNNTSVFIAGSRVLQRTDATNYSTNPTIYVGNDNTNTYSWNGYIDDFRITKGYARYSGSTYTVPTAAFPLQ